MYFNTIQGTNYVSSLFIDKSMNLHVTVMHKTLLPHKPDAL